MRTLSIIILSYNTEHITRECLDSLIKNAEVNLQTHFEIIVVDNASSDNSPQMLQNYRKNIRTNNVTMKIILNELNEGFPKGNNRGVRESGGEYTLFLNSDVFVGKVDWNDVLDYMEKNKDIGVLTVKVNLQTNTIDPASHRGFPTIWNSFCYYAGLERLATILPMFAPWFGGYHLTQYSLSTPHEIDSPSGAFYLTRRAIFDNVGGFDETFFMYGEDLDLSYRIKQRGLKVIYYPFYEVLHLKHASGLKKKKTSVKSKTKQYFYDAMKIFYRKHYASQQPFFVNNLIYFFIDIKAKL